MTNPTPELQWYALRVNPGYEATAKALLLSRIKQSDQGGNIPLVILPKQRGWGKSAAGKKAMRPMSLPGYLLVKMRLTEETKKLVASTPKVTGFVGNATPLTETEQLQFNLR